jgi:exportin-2 (importin alpha re-exporter)
VLHLVSSLSAATAPQEIAIRQSAAVLFKNAVKRMWKPEDDTVVPIPAADRTTIRSHLVSLMCSTPPDVQRQLAEAVSIIAKHDFPAQWPTLLPELVAKLREGNLLVSNGVMLTANSIFKKFRYSYQSDALLEELAYSLKEFQEPLMHTFVMMGSALPSLEGDRAQLLVLLETIRLICRIFYSLNWQDIPEYFEDNCATWMGEFAKYLTYKNPSLTSSSSTEPGPVEKIQAAILENIVLYVSKYEEQFSAHLQAFTQTVWGLLLEVGHGGRFDLVATNGIKFLSAVSAKEANKPLFTDAVLRQIIEQIVVKNLSCSETDAELFEDNPPDYIRKDMEGGDTDTRRRCACDLVRSLLKFFPAQVSSLCVGYTDALLSSYGSTGDWRMKDAALHLLLAVAVVNSSASSGAGALNPLVNIQDAFTTHVMPEVQASDINSRPIVKADAIKLICVFRSHFPREFLLGMLPHLVRYLMSEHVVVQTYSAICIEKFLLVKDPAASGTAAVVLPGSKPAAAAARIGKADLLPLLNPLFNGLFSVLENTELPENDYVMKCIMRVLGTIGADIAPVSDLVMHKLTRALERVCKNPTNPHFNHYLFECLALIVRSCCGSGDLAAISKMEALLFPPFQSVLSFDVEEFIPYVFQILGQLLSCRPENSGLSDAYRALFVPLLAPVLWERKGNVPALTDLFLAYLSRGSAGIVSGGHMPGVLGVFQKLLSSKVWLEYNVFYLT